MVTHWHVATRHRGGTIRPVWHEAYATAEDAYAERSARQRRDNLRTPWGKPSPHWCIVSCDRRECR